MIRFFVVMLLWVLISTVGFADDGSLHGKAEKLGEKLSATTSILSRKYEVDTITQFCSTAHPVLSRDVDASYANWCARNLSKANMANHVRESVLDAIKDITCKGCASEFSKTSDFYIKYMGDTFKKQMENSDVAEQVKLCTQYISHIEAGDYDIKNSWYEKISDNVLN